MGVDRWAGASLRSCQKGVGSMDFKRQLASALVLNMVLKLFTFALNILLTRQLEPSESGVNFSCQLYFNTVLFLARDCVRSVNARHNLRDHAGNGKLVLQVMNCAIASLPLGIIIIVFFDLLPMCGIHVFPSLVAFSRVSGDSFTAEKGQHGVSVGLPELLLVLSILLSLMVEPCVALVQSFDYVRIIVASEFWALLARLITCFVFVKVCGGLGGDLYTARMCFATGALSYAIATVVYFVWLWNDSRCHQNDKDGDNEDDLLQKAWKGVVELQWGVISPSFTLSWPLFLRTLLPWYFLSWHMARVEVVKGASLLRQFFNESCLRLVLTEGERFALAAFGSAAAMGHYDLVANLGSLIARLLFRVWENACFVKWSRDAAKGDLAEAVVLLFTMLRIASYFGGAVVLLVPPLAEGFLCGLFSHRWASPTAVRALQLYCYMLPLMGWYGLMDAFVRATASEMMLRLLQRVMLAQAVMYAVACFVVLRLQLVDDPVAGLIIVNSTSMTLRCVSSIVLILLLKGPVISSQRTNETTSLILKLFDFKAVLNLRVFLIWVILFICTRRTTSGPIAALIAAPIYLAAVLKWDSEICLMALTSLKHTKSSFNIMLRRFTTEGLFAHKWCVQRLATRFCISIHVPTIAESISSGKVVGWTKKVGDTVSEDEIICQIESDKLNVDVRAPKDGVITKINFTDGQIVEVGVELSTMKESTTENEVTSSKAPQQQQQQETQTTTTKKIPAVMSSSPSTTAPQQQPAQVMTTTLGADPRVRSVRISSMRQRIADRLKASQNTCAMLTTFNEIDMTPLIHMRNKYKDDFFKKHNVKLGFMSPFVKACAIALQDIPIINASFGTEFIEYHDYVDISIAVSTPRGLVVPVLRDVQKSDFAQIEKQILDFGERAKVNKLTLAEMTGGTFTISNGGVFGSWMGTPIINPPQSAILGMHAIKKKPWVVGEEIQIRDIMAVALTYDHRLIDGSDAVRFLVKIKNLIEDPTRMVLNLA